MSMPEKKEMDWSRGGLLVCKAVMVSQPRPAIVPDFCECLRVLTLESGDAQIPAAHQREPSAAEAFCDQVDPLIRAVPKETARPD